jgi:hypothetical protein
MTVPSRWFPGMTEMTTASRPEWRPRASDTDDESNVPLKATTHIRLLAAGRVDSSR